ncbi:MAG: type II toxin-antitoxin system mRNA interferase toxin, RelE/StbE family [Spirochaetia bacterium]|nr:type II toxin-antitoxin system mRNA interferase toxin, RelE/StbE family [Spirochaetia bacterium]
MINIDWNTRFEKIFKKWTKKYPELINTFEERLDLFVQEPFNPKLKTHPLTGNMKDYWSLSITYDHRLIFVFKENRTIAVLVDIGTHDEVY